MVEKPEKPKPKQMSSTELIIFCCIACLVLMLVCLVLIFGEKNDYMYHDGHHNYGHHNYGHHNYGHHNYGHNESISEGIATGLVKGLFQSKN